MNEVDKILRIISHDLMGHAVSLRDASDLMLQYSHKWEKEQVDKYYCMMHETAKEQIDMLKALKIWMKTLTGRYYFRPVCFDFGYVLKSEFDDLKKLAEIKGVELELDVPDTLRITGDVQILCTVVRHLLSNGLKYTAKGGFVSLSVSDGNDKSDYDGYKVGKVTVSVCDTGIGMSCENLYSLDGSSHRAGTDGETGNGLGLVICRDLLKLHDSELHVFSEEGHGSRFWFEI